MKKIYILSFILAFTTVAYSQEFFVFPSEGQSQEQMERDKADCMIWARNQTGFDPMQQPTATTPPPQQGARQGGVIRGGARGAIVGTTAGAISGNTGRGAAIGASTGALMGGFRAQDQRRNQQAANQQWANQQAAIHAQERDRFNRAWSACLQGKGYGVN